MSFQKQLIKIWRFLQSRRFALILFFAVIIFTITGAIVPQSIQDPTQYKLWVINHPELAKLTTYLLLDNIFSAWYFNLISILLFINTLLCTLKQVKSILKSKSEYLFSFDRSNCRASFEVQAGHEVFNGIRKFFKARHYRLKEPEDNEIKVVYAYRGRLGKWGIVIFHLGLLIILGSVFYGSLTKMDGTAYLGVGQTFTDRAEEYYRIKYGWLFGPDDHLGYQMTLKDAKLDYSQGYPDVSKVDLTFWGDSEEGYDYSGNGGTINYQGVRIYKENVGYAPAIVFTDDQNRVLFSTLQDIDTIFHLGNRVTYQTHMQFPQFKLKADLEFYPDATVNGKNVSVKSQQPRNPQLYLRIRQGTQIIYDGFIKTGARIKLANNLFLNYPEYRNWVSFHIVRDGSAGGVFFGFALSLLGLAVYYIVLPYKYAVVLEEANDKLMVVIYGYTNKFPVLFREKFATTVEKVKKEFA